MKMYCLQCFRHSYGQLEDCCSKCGRMDCVVYDPADTKDSRVFYDADTLLPHEREDILTDVQAWHQKRRSVVNRAEGYEQYKLLEAERQAAMEELSQRLSTDAAPPPECLAMSDRVWDAMVNDQLYSDRVELNRQRLVDALTREIGQVDHSMKGFVFWEDLHVHLHE